MKESDGRSIFCLNCGMSGINKIGISMGIAVLLTVIGGFIALPKIANRDGYHLAFPAFLFPYAALFSRGDARSILIWITAQFPVYGVIFASAWIKDCEVKVGWRLLVLHMLLGIGCALIASADKLVR